VDRDRLDPEGAGRSIDALRDLDTMRAAARIDAVVNAATATITLKAFMKSAEFPTRSAHSESSLGSNTRGYVWQAKR
jgi:hypothetical protein